MVNPVTILCLLTFLLATSVAWGVFEAMPHAEDEFAYLFQAKVFAGGEITVETPLNQYAFFLPFIIDLDGRRFSKYTPGFSLALALGVLLGSPWIVNALGAALGVAGTYLLGRELFGRSTGLLAAALGAVSPMFVIHSGTLLSHTTALAAVAFFAWAFVRTRRTAGRRRPGFALLAGALLGWVLLARPWTGAAIALPFACLALYDVGLSRGGALRWYGWMLLAILLVASLLPLYNLATTGSPTTNTYALLWDYDSVGVGPDYGRGEEGYTWRKVRNNTRNRLEELGDVLLGWPTLAGVPLTWPAVAGGLVVKRRRRRAWALLAPPLALVVFYALYWGLGYGFYGPRYYASGTPFLWLLAARGLLALSTHRWPRRALALALPLFLAWSIATQIQPRFVEGRGRFNISRRDTGAIAAAGLHDALVFVRGDYWTDYANLSWLNTPRVDGDVVYCRDRGAESNREIIAAYPGRELYHFDHDREPALLVYQEELSR